MDDRTRIVSEKDFQGAVITLARYNGWKVMHPYSSFRTTPGFPDLTMVRDGRLIFAELKTNTGRLSPAQKEWGQLLRKVALETTNNLTEPGVVKYFLWRPSDWDEIERMLSR